MDSSVRTLSGSAHSPASSRASEAVERASRTSNALTPDICIIGAGSGGLSVAAACASLGVRVVLIEKHKMGGDCLNAGCVPSKSLIAIARRAHQIRSSARFGIAAREPDIDFKQVSARIHGVIDAIAANDGAARFNALGVDVIRDAGRFADAHTVKAGDIEIRARRFVIATGSSPVVPKIPGLNQVPYLTNESVFKLDRPVGHLLVIGGGAVGLELAQAYQRLGAHVTIFDTGLALSNDDPELTAVALRALRKEGVVIHETTAIARIEGRGDSIKITFSGGVATGTHVLVATGRKPNIDGLGLEAAGIRSDAKGIKVNGGLVTSNRRVFAIGDVTGGAQFTHVANHHAGIVVRRALFRLPSRVKTDQFPRVTFTEPEIAQVGLTEQQALQRRYAISIYRWPFGDNDRAHTDGYSDGLIKVICDRRGKVLGAGIVGANAGELIHLWSLALSQGLNIKAMTQWIAPYPTFGEISKRAAFGALADDARRPLVRKVLSVLRKFG